MVNVPRMPELSVQQLIGKVASDKILAKYLPDLVAEEGKFRTINRQYLFNVINTIKPDFFPANIRALMQARKDMAAEKNKTFIEINSNIYNLIVNSQLINRSKYQIEVVPLLCICFLVTLNETTSSNECLQDIINDI